MAVNIKIPTINGITLYTKNKYVEDDIVVDVGIPYYDGSASVDVTPNEDGFVTRTLTTYKNDRVTYIGDRAFKENVTILEVNFPNVETIGQVAFYGCTNLTNAYFPKATTIEQSAFAGCKSLVSFDFSKVETIQNSAFNSCTSLEEITIQSITLNNECFRYCSNLKYVHLKGFKGFSNGGHFADCTNLETFIISDIEEVVSLPSNTFNRSGIANGIGYIYVPDTLVEQYKSATNWSVYADFIKPLSELPSEEE